MGAKGSDAYLISCFCVKVSLGSKLSKKSTFCVVCPSPYLDSANCLASSIQNPQRGETCLRKTGDIIYCMRTARKEYVCQL